jgi:hypothetical protein
MSNVIRPVGEVASYRETHPDSPLSVVITTAREAANNKKTQIPTGDYINLHDGTVIEIQPDFVIGVIDFTPFGLRNKNPDFVLEGLDAGLQSLPQLVDWLKQIPTNDQPFVIIGKTNPIMAQIAENKMGFGQYKSPAKGDNEKYVAMYTDDFIRAFDKRNKDFQRAVELVSKRLNQKRQRG